MAPRQIVTRRDARAGKFFWAYVGVASAGAAVYPFVHAPVGDALYLAASFAVLLAVSVGIRINRPAMAAPWLLLAAGLKHQRHARS